MEFIIFQLLLALPIKTELIQASGNEQTFEISCDQTTLASENPTTSSGTLILKLIKNGQCLSESIAGPIKYVTKNDDLAYGEYQCISVDTTVPSITILKTIIIIPPSRIFSSDSTRGLYRLKAGVPFPIICGSTNQDTRSKGSIRLYKSKTGQTLKLAKSPSRLSADTTVIPSLSDSYGSYKCIRSGESQDVSPDRYIYPSQICSYALTIRIIVYDFLPYSRYSSRNYKIGDTVAFSETPPNTVWKFGTREIFLPSTEFRNVQVIDGVLYITNATILNTGIYTAVTEYEIFKIAISFNGGKLKSTLDSSSDSVDSTENFPGDQFSSDEDSSNAHNIPARFPEEPCPRSTYAGNKYASTNNGRYRDSMNGGDQSDVGKVYRTEIGSSFRYACEGSGPGIDYLYFKKDGVKIPSSIIQRTALDRIKTVLEIPVAQFSDSGYYECVMEFSSSNSAYPSTKILSFTLLVDPK